MTTRTTMANANPRSAFSVYFLSVAAIFALLITDGCNSKASKTADEPPAAQKNTTPPTNTTPTIDLNCVMTHIQNPPGSFHYSFKNESANPWMEEANVTPQAIDGSFSNGSMPTPQKFHGAPQEVSSNLMAIGQMSSIFATVRNTSAVVSEGKEDGLNGYSTFKYSIDTTHGSATERELYKSVLGLGGFEKGTVWITSDGCPVKIILEEELHSKDGSLSGKAHYEEAMTKM